MARECEKNYNGYRDFVTCGINIHINDSESVAREKKTCHFRTIIPNENTVYWTTFVLNSIT